MKKTSTIRQTLTIFWHYTMRYKALFAIGTIGSVLGITTQSIVSPLIIAKAFEKLQAAYTNHETLEFSAYAGYFWSFAALMIAGVLVWRLQTYCVWRFEIAIRRDMARDIYNHLQAQSQRFHADRFGGSMVSQTGKFMSAYERLMDDFVWNITPSITAFVGSIGVLFFVSYQYALVLLTVATIYMAIMYKRMRRQLPYNRKEAEMESKQTGALADAITNMAAIRSFAHDDYESKRFANVTGKTYKASMDLAHEALKTDALSHGQINMFHIIAFGFGLIAITTMNAEVSVLYLVLSYTHTIVDRLWQFGRIMRNMSRSFGDAAEMTEMLGITPEIPDPAEPVPSTIHRGNIEFRNVTFFYPDGKQTKPLFKNLNLKIKPGEKIGLVGHSGGGKTTVTKLLLRFMDIQKGTIFVDGQDITSITQHDLRSRIAYVPQEPMLFHRSLAENVRYGNIDASDQEMIAVAKMAHAHEFIEHLPHGYDTLVGERGVKLSGGQRQRIAIARAMLKHAPILVLDEATSALDSESEVLIQDALWKLMEGRTAIVIAHRLSTIQKMDRIIVLDKGQIVEEGSHKELIRQNGVYASLWSHQSGGFLED